MTAVELLPVHHIADESFLHERGLTNYWGYSTIGFLAPHSAYAATGIRGQEVREFKGMVKALHRAGIEVILDVVYNHTAEGNHLGPMLSFRGVDNASYYRLMPEDPRHYMDFTGTGNSLNPVHPSVLRLIMDSLRYWVIECHVDGFRFDLASALAREFYDVDRLSAFFDTIHQDPVLSQVKLIAEPWDVGPGGYQVGNFPVLWSEWNGIYRDVMRDFWRGEASVADFASRLHRELDDLYQRRRPLPVRLDQLHHRPRRLHAARPRLLQREAQRGQPGGQPRRHRRQPLVELRRRGGDRRPGDHRPARPPAAQLPGHAAALPGHADAARRRRARPHPGRQQQRLVPGQRDLLVRLGVDDRRASCSAFTRRLIALRAEHPVFRRRQFLSGTEEEGSGLPDVCVVPGRRRADDRRRLARRPRCSGCSSTARRSTTPDAHGQRIVDDSFLLLFNAHHEDVAFTLPERALRRARGRSSCARTSRWATEPRRRSRPAGTCRLSSRARWSCCAGAHDGAARHLPAAARRRASASPRRARSCPTCADLGVSHLYLPPSFQARAGSTHGYDVVDPARSRPSWAGRRSSARWPPPRARPAWGSCSTSSPTTWRSTTRTATGATRRCARSSSTSTRRPAATGASSTSTTSPACARRIPRCSTRRTGWRSRSCARGPSTGCASTIRTGSPTRPATCERLRDGGVEHVWVEKILDPGEQLRDWPVDGTVGYEFLNDVAALFVDPAGEAPLTELWERAVGRRAAASTSRVRGQARAGADDVPAGGRAAAPRGAADARPGSSGRSRRCRSTAPTSSRGRGGWRTPTARRSRRRGSRIAGAAAAARGARRGRVRHALPADDAAGDGQGRRGHGLLPLRAGCSRSTTSAATPAASACRWRSSTPPTRCARRASRAGCW